MTQFQIKEFDLRFIIDRGIDLKNGINVSLSDVTPTTKEDFYWVAYWWGSCPHCLLVKYTFGYDP